MDEPKIKEPKLPEINKKPIRNSPARYHRMSMVMENVRIAPIIWRELGNEWANHYQRDVIYLLKLLEIAEDKLKEKESQEK